MQLTITDEAKSALNKISDPSKPYLKLHFDTTDCMCSIDGTPTIRFVEQKEENDLIVESEDFQVLVSENDQMYFEKEVTLEHLDHSFRLNSPAGMINPIISEHAVLEGLSSDHDSKM